MAMRPEVVIGTPCPADLSCVCSTEVIVNGEIMIPPQKPEFEKILDFRVSSKVTDFQVIDTPLGNKVIVQGIVNIGVQYVANCPEQPVHFAHFELPWNTFFLCADEFCDITACVEFADFKCLDHRTLQKLVVLFVCARTPGTCPPVPPCPCPTTTDDFC